MSRNASRSSGRLVGLRALGVSQGRLDLDAKPQKWTKQTVKLAHLTLVKWKPKPGMCSVCLCRNVLIAFLHCQTIIRR